MNASPARPVLVLLKAGAPWTIDGALPPRQRLAALREVDRREAAFARQPVARHSWLERRKLELAHLLGRA